MEDLTGKQLGNYSIIQPLGEGGMAAVYKAYQMGQMTRHVALKVLPRQFMQDPMFLGRFRQEANVLARLQHPHILPVFDYGETDEGYVYLAMPLIESGTLSSLMKGQPLPLIQIRQMIGQTADALDYAHGEGVVHRDVKPSNVLIDERGNGLLSDFGISKMVEGATQFTATGALVGTPAYMSPEQGQGKELDGRSDIYSLGVIIFQMATGRVPYQAETPVAVIYKHVSDPLPAPRTINPNLPEAVELVILKSLMKDPAGRYQTAAEMADAIRTAIPERAVELEPTLLEPQETAPKVEEEPPAIGIAPVEPSMSMDSAYPDPAIVKEVEQAAAVEDPASRPMSGVDVALTISLVALFGLIAACSGLLALFSIFTDGLAIFPLLFGIAVGSLGVMVMVWFHRRYPMSWIILIAAAIMWLVGGSLFAFGITATLTNSDAEFIENLGFAVGLCMGPGGFLALAGLALYFFAARRARKNVPS